MGSMLLTLRLPLPSSEPRPRHAFVTFDGDRVVDLRITHAASPALEAIAARFPEARLACEPGLHRFGFALGFFRHDSDSRLKIVRLTAAMILADPAPAPAHAAALLEVARASARLWRARPAPRAGGPLEVSGALRGR